MGDSFTVFKKPQLQENNDLKLAEDSLGNSLGVFFPDSTQPMQLYYQCNDDRHTTRGILDALKTVVADAPETADDAALAYDSIKDVAALVGALGNAMPDDIEKSTRPVAASPLAQACNSIRSLKEQAVSKSTRTL